MSDGEISLGTPFAQKLGFTPDKFQGGSYLWKTGSYITVSFIASTESSKGYLRSLFDRIVELGYGIRVPTPFPRMEKICLKYGFEKQTEYIPEMQDMLELMVFEPVDGVEAE